jgi:membrane protease YdiL (CAAX protease family)
MAMLITPCPEDPSDDPGFGFIGILKLVTVIFGVAVLVTVLALIVAHVLGLPMERWTDTISALGFMGGATWGYGYLIVADPGRPWFALDRGPRGHLGTVFLACGVMTIILLAELVIKLLCSSYWPQALYTPSGLAGYEVLYLLVSAPILEEMVYRGILLNGLTKRYGFATANGLSSLLFGLSHGHPLSIVCTTVIALMLGFLFHRTRSILPCIGLHIYNNFLALTLTWWPDWFVLAVAPVVLLALVGLFWNGRKGAATGAFDTTLA